MAPTGGPSEKKPEMAKKGLLSHVMWQHLAAGISGGVASTMVLHPLDLVKVRFQVNEGPVVGLSTKRPQYTGIWDAFRTIQRTEGVRGLYRGVTPNVWGAGASWGLYFLFYNALKAWLAGADGVSGLGAGQHMLAATEAGIGTLVLTNPIWVAKTRLCLQYDGQAASAQYRGMLHCLTSIYRAEGVPGLYKGFVPGVFGVSHGALQFMAYEDLKRRYNRHKGRDVNAKFSSGEYLCFAALSKIFAATLTYPYQVVRSRLQDQHREYTGAMHVMRSTWSQEGWRGFYKGLGPSLLRVTPACCITFVVYEKTLNFLLS